MGAFLHTRILRWGVGAFVIIGGRAVLAQGAGLDSATAAVIAPIVAQVRAAGLPTDLLTAKAREGQVQRVPLPKIEAAVRAVAARIQVANDALAPKPSDEEVRAAVDAIKNGVPVETLRAMRKEGRDGSLAVPLGVLTSLILRGVPVEKASMQVVELLQRGAVPTNFIALEERVRQVQSSSIGNGRRRWAPSRDPQATALNTNQAAAADTFLARVPVVVRRLRVLYGRGDGERAMGPANDH